MAPQCLDIMAPISAIFRFISNFSVQFYLFNFNIRFLEVKAQTTLEENMERSGRFQNGKILSFSNQFYQKKLKF